MKDQDRPREDSKSDRPADDFYEAMPATADDFGRDDQADESRMTALVTLLLVALVAIALAVLFLRGLDTIRDTVPVQPSTGAITR